MNLPNYQLTSSPDFLSFEFVSEGPRGHIVKQIQFTPLENESVYNLAFGDISPANREIDDKVVSNNGDSEKVLATVVAAAFIFLKRNPNAWVYATGSNAARTRLYQMGISRFLDTINDVLEIYGQIEENWCPFERNKSYVAFLAHRKNH